MDQIRETYSIHETKGEKSLNTGKENETNLEERRNKVFMS